MIVITGSVTAKPGSMAPLRAEALAHCERSRAEDGCLTHRVFVDALEPDRLFFYEEWRDMTAVEAHLRHPEMPRIVAAIRTHAAASAGPMFLDATPVER